MNHPGKKNLLRLCSWQNLAGRRQSCLGIIYNRPTAQFSAGLRAEPHAYPSCPGRANPRTSVPHTNSKATVPRQSLARRLGFHSHARWHRPLSSGISLAGCRAGLLLFLQLGNSVCMGHGHGPAPVQPVCRTLGSAGGAGVTTQLDLPSWEGGGKRVQPKPM